MKLFGLLAVFAVLSLLGLNLLKPVPAKAITGDTPIVAELFTSQSCSSCPPADQVLEALSENDRIIALSCHVTYWNHLHWKDTLSQPFCTQRQRDYAHALKARGPYTPQIVINGRYEMVGSRRGAVFQTARKAAAQDDIKPITLREENNALIIQLPDSGQKQSDLLLYAFEKRHTQSIPSGENRGRTVRYTNPVKHLISLGSWDGSAQTLRHDISDLDVQGGYAVIAQTPRHGPIIAAGQIKR